MAGSLRWRLKASSVAMTLAFSLFFSMQAGEAADAIAGNELVVRAKQARAALRTDSALVLLNEALKINPKNNAALYERTDVYMELGKFDLALKDTNLLISIKPQAALYYKRRAKILDITGHSKEALPDYTMALKLEPNDSGCWRNKAIAYRRVKDYLASAKAYESSLTACGDCAERSTLMISRADMYFKANDMGKALQSYDELVKQFPEHSAGHYGRAKIFERAGKTELAAKENELGKKLDLSFDPLLAK